jgi:hypothetical protein
MRISDRRRVTHGRRPDSRLRSGSGLFDARTTVIALALLILLGLAAFPLLRDGRVLANLGAGLQHWVGANR